MTRFRDDRFDSAPASLSLAIRRQQLNEHYAKQLTEIVVTDDEVQEERFAAKLPGDEKALRGIPAIGRGVTGAIPRTRPGDGLDSFSGRPVVDLRSDTDADVVDESQGDSPGPGASSADARACA